MSKFDYAKLLISGEDFEREINKDYSAEDALRDFVFWVFRCKSNNINIENAETYGKAIARDVEDTVMEKMIEDIAESILEDGVTLNKVQINDLKENGLYDDFLKKLNELREED